MPEVKIGRYMCFQVDTDDINRSVVRTSDQIQKGFINLDISGANEAQQMRLLDALQGGMESRDSILPLIVAWVAAYSKDCAINLTEAAQQIDLPEGYIIGTLDPIAVGPNKTRTSEFYLTPLLSQVASKAA